MNNSKLVCGTRIGDRSGKTMKLKLSFVRKMLGLNKSVFASIRDHHMFVRELNNKSIVIDLGANKGDFSTRISDNFGCQCYSIEAAPQIFDTIPDNPLIKKYNYAICGECQPVKLYLSANSQRNTIIKDVSSAWGSTGTVTIAGITLENFIKQQQIGVIDFLKVDVEGAEIEIFDSLKDETLLSMKQIAVEFHDFCKGLDITDSIIKLKKRFKTLGFLRISFKNNYDVLFINKHKIKFSLREKVYILIYRIFLTVKDILNANALGRLVIRQFKKIF